MKGDLNDYSCMHDDGIAIECICILIVLETLLKLLLVVFIITQRGVIIPILQFRE